MSISRNTPAPVEPLDRCLTIPQLARYWRCRRIPWRALRELAERSLVAGLEAMLEGARRSAGQRNSRAPSKDEGRL